MSEHVQTPRTPSVEGGRLLIVYGTTEGHTREVAQRMADVARAAGVGTEVADSAAAAARLGERWDAVIVGASVHQGHHQTTVSDFVKANLPLLGRVPGAFFSVSLSAAVQDPAHQQEAQGYIESFLKDTGWRPRRTLSLAGALRQGEYGPYERLVLDLLGYQLGGGTVVSRDVSYTDLAVVEAFVRDFLAEALNAPKMPRKTESLAHLTDADLRQWR